jgi:oligopeptide transport system substrate-binding protein
MMINRMKLLVLCASAMTLALPVTAVSQAAELRTNINADPAMVDPITYSELIAGDVMANVYEGFVGLDPDGNIVPALAESWKAHDDGLGFTFTLRPGVKFHSGRNFGAKDVKYTFEQLLIPGNRGGLNAEYLDVIVGAQALKDGGTTELEGVSVVDELTLEVRFSKADVLFPIYPFYFMDSGIVEEHGADWATKASAGTGPFKFKEWNLGRDVQLEAFSDYWGGAPEIDGMRFIVVPSGDTAVSMYEAGELDVVYVDTQTIRRVLKDPQFKDEMVTAPAAQIRYLGMNQNLYEPFKDVRVREAVCIGFDRDAMVEGLYDGAAFPLYGQVTPGVAGYNPDLKPIPFDPERAKKLLAEAGYPNGEGLPPLKVTSTEPNKNDITYFASQFSSVLGMPVEVEIVERGTHIKRMNAGEVPFFPWGWSAGYPDALYFLSQVWYGPSTYNRSRWQNDEFDGLIEKAQGTADEKARYALYNTAEKILLDDWGTCPTTVRMQVALVKPNVKGVSLTPFRFLPFGDVQIAE